MEFEAAPSLYFDPPKCNITQITYPKEFKALIFDIYMCFLEVKPDNILEFLIQYFETMKKMCGSTKLSCSGPDTAKVDFVDVDEKYFQTRRDAVCDENTHPRTRLKEIDANSKSFEVKRHLGDVLRKIVFLRHLEKSTIDNLSDALQFKKYYDGEYVIIEGDELSNFFIVNSGKFTAVKSTANGDIKTIGKYKPGNYFGIQAFFHNQPAPFSVITNSNIGKLWTISRKTFRDLMLNNEYMKFMDYTSYIDSRNVLFVLPENERLQIIDILEIKTYDDDKIIFREGDLSDGMYIVIKGKVQFSVLTNGVGSIKEMITCRASQGAHFGELSLVYPCNRTLTAKTLGETRIIFISSEKFQRLLPHRIRKIRKSIQANPNPLFRIHQVDSTYYEV